MQTDNAPFCSSGSPDPELFEIGRSQTTNEGMSFRFCYLRCKRITPLSIVQDLAILNCLSSGTLKLQMGITEFGPGMSLLRKYRVKRPSLQVRRTCMSIEKRASPLSRSARTKETFCREKDSLILEMLEILQILLQTISLARDRPSPYGERDALGLARDRPSLYGERDALGLTRDRFLSPDRYSHINPARW